MRRNAVIIVAMFITLLRFRKNPFPAGFSKLKYAPLKDGIFRR